jgi:hypothetical protein
MPRRLSRARVLRVSLLLVGFSLPAAAARAGPAFQLLAQDRSVSATAGANGGAMTEDRDAARGFAPFDGQAVSEFSDDDYRVTAVATTASALTERRMSFSGHVSVTSFDLDPDDDAGGPVDAAAVAEGSVTFRLGESHRLRFSTTVPYPRDFSDPAEPGNDFSLLRETGSGASAEVLLDARNGGAAVQMLRPGTYTFSYYHDATTFPGVPGEGDENSFATELQLEAVPLPRGVWTGAIVLGGIVVLAQFRARRMRRG